MIAPVQNAQAGSSVGDRPVSEEFEQLFRRSYHRAYNAAYRMMGNASDAEDVLQTVFLRLVRLEAFPDISNLPGYLHRSAVNASLDLLRGKKETFSLDEDPNQTEVVSTDHGPHSAELRDWLRHALAKLNPRWAEMFVLRFIEDYSNREIAGLMNTSAAVVAVVLHRTRTQLKKDFKGSTRGTR